MNVKNNIKKEFLFISLSIALHLIVVLLFFSLSRIEFSEKKQDWGKEIEVEVMGEQFKEDFLKTVYVSPSLKEKLLKKKKGEIKDNKEIIKDKDIIKGAELEKIKKEQGEAGDATVSTKDVEIFPSKEKISQIARDIKDSPPALERGTTMSLNTTDIKYQRYLLSVKRRIELFWQYPPSSIRRGEQGSLKLDFKINKDGTLVFADVKKSSNYAMLDDAAQNAIRLAGPFSPFPQDFEKDYIEVNGLFIYRILTP